MIKRANQKKKKGFSLIELIIVLAVMAIIALIAIPNFTKVRENSKDKADLRSCETIQKTVLMLVADETITTDGTATVTFKKDKTINKVTGLTPAVNNLLLEELSTLTAPQGKDAVGYTIEITGENVTVKPTEKTTTP